MVQQDEKLMDLVLRAQKGDIQAFGQLVKKYQAAVHP